MIRLEHVSKIYKGDMYVTKALDNVSCHIDKGEFIAIMGPSGAGKTTLLNIIGGIDRPSAGNVIIGGEDISDAPDKVVDEIRRDNMCFIFQHFALMSQYMIYENIESPLLARGVKKSARKERIQEVAGEVGIENLLFKYPNQLSGGQRQRAALARAMAADCRIVLADEPTGALDEDNSHKVMEILRHMHDQEKTIIVITHDEKVAECADREIYLENGKITEHS